MKLFNGTGLYKGLSGSANVTITFGGVGPRLTQVHEAYAEVLEARGDLVAANRHLRQAIASHRPAAPYGLESRIAIA